MIATLIALKDIPGVAGSFVLTPAGELAARDMPSIYKDDIFSEIGRRFNDIAEASADQIQGLQEVLVKFEGYWLLTRRTPTFSLNILAAEGVNYPALKMAANVAVRHIGEAPVEAMAAAALPAAPASPEAPANGTGSRRTWRGKLIE